MAGNQVLFQEVFAKADAAGKAAVVGFKPQPMVVVAGERYYHVEDGACGFAWVSVKPANKPFAKFLVANGARKSYAGGVDLWCGAYNQSIEKKEQYCQAFAEVVRSHPELEVACYAHSRMD